MGSGPAANPGDLPVLANFGNKNPRMSVKTIAIISLSSFVLLLVLVGAFFILLKWKRFGRSSNAVGPAFISSIKKRTGKVLTVFQFCEYFMVLSPAAFSGSNFRDLGLSYCLMFSLRLPNVCCVLFSLLFSRWIYPEYVMNYVHELRT